MTFESVAIIGAFCTLIGVILKWEGNRNKTFVSFVSGTMKQIEDYHTVKNGHIERVAKEFTLSLKEMSDKINRANENQINTIEVLSDCAHALDNYHKDKILKK